MTATIENTSPNCWSVPRCCDYLLSHGIYVTNWPECCELSRENVPAVRSACCNLIAGIDSATVADVLRRACSLDVELA